MGKFIPSPTSVAQRAAPTSAPQHAAELNAVNAFVQDLFAHYETEKMALRRVFK